MPRTPRTIRRRLVGAALVTGLAVAGSLLSAAPANATTVYGVLTCSQHQTLETYGFDSTTFSFRPGDFCVSDGVFRLTFQTDGNFVLYDRNKALWATYTSTTKGTLRLQTDGNIVIYDGNSKALWSSKTGGNHYNDYYINNDGLLYAGPSWQKVTPIWSAFFEI